MKGKTTMRKSVLLATIIITPLILGGCGNHAHSEENSSKSVKSEKISSSLKSIKSSSSSLSSQSKSLQSSSSNKSSSSKQNSSSMVSSSSKVKNVTPQQLGIILTLSQEPEIIQGGTPLYYENGATNNQNGPTQGFNVISTNGDGTANIYYKQQGDQVVVKQMDPNSMPSGGCIADEKLKTETFSISQLVNKYYSTPQQQSQVNNEANQLKSY